MNSILSRANARRGGLAGVLVVAVALTVGAATFSPARQGTAAPPADRPAIDRTAELYKGVARSTVYIESGHGAGSGFLVDAQRRLVVTARHVVGDEQTVSLVSAQFDASGDVVTDSTFYARNAVRLTVRGEVVARDADRDVAVIRLDAVPAGMVALPLAKDGPRPGQAIHLVGCSSSRFGGLFGYRNGVVACVYRSTPSMTARNAEVVEVTVPTNHGDSGGPIVNDRGELVSIVSQGTDGTAPPRGTTYHGVQVTDHSVHVREVRAVLATVAK